MRILIAAGGTGGHIFPALEVAKDLIANGHEVLWVGTAHGLETKILSAENIPLLLINAKGLRGKGLKRKLSAPFMLISALFESLYLLLKHKPAVVLGMGGYVTGPIGLAARLLGIKLVIHEQNAVAGLTNKILAKFANKVFLGFPSAFKNKENDSKFIFVGNPIRNAISDISKTKDFKRFIATNDQLRVLVLGGSLGASFINNMIIGCLKGLPSNIKLEFWHQTGNKDFEAIKSAYAKIGVPSKVSAFIDDMPKAYAWADLVIARAGALTVTEIAASGLPSILIPLPHAVDDHQTKNAMFIVKQDAAILLPEAKVNAAKLQELLIALINNPTHLSQMSANVRVLSQVDAKASIVKELLI